ADVARAFLLPQDFPTIQPEEEGQEDKAPAIDTGNLAAFSAMLWTHNVAGTLMVFALGITLGLGTAWLVFYNGVTTGALMAGFWGAGPLKAVATGILPHGVLEIPAALPRGPPGFLPPAPLLPPPPPP